MKLKTKIVLYYMIATLVTAFFVGTAVVQNIEKLSIRTIEKQLTEQSNLAESYISQIYLLQKDDSQSLNIDTANLVIDNLGLLLGNIRIYNPEVVLLASSQRAVVENKNEIDNSTSLNEARKGRYAYIIKNDTVYFASPIRSGNKMIGLLNIIYPMSFFKSLISGVTNILFLGVLCFILLMVLLSVYIARQVTKPVKLLASAAKQYAIRNFVPVQIKTNDEIAFLGKSFNTMGMQLQDYIKRQQQLVSNVSHEIRTPLTAIIGYSEIVLNEAGEQPDLQKAVYHLKNESNRLIGLVDKFLTLSRIDEEREPFNFEKLDLSLLVQDIIEKMLLRAEKYNIRISVNLEHDVYIWGDHDKLVQVLVNLVDNAIKFSHSNTTIQITLIKNMESATLTIIDQGIGIPQENLSKLFERFYRAENAKGIPGTGLGLSIVKFITDAHNGVIEYNSVLGKGTTVLITLPLFNVTT